MWGSGNQSCKDLEVESKLRIQLHLAQLGDEEPDS